MIAYLKQIANRIGKTRLITSIVLFALGMPLARLIFLVVALVVNVSTLQSLADTPSPTAIVSAGPTIQAARYDITALRNEAGFILRIGPALRSVPVIGPDLVYANNLLDMATEMVIAADETYSGLAPLMGAALGEANHPTPDQVLDFLTAAKPHFEQAQAAITNAQSARTAIPLDELSPIGQRLVNKTDRLLFLMRQGIAAINIAPALLGADGQKTYLMLIQNQDELRPTGGFLSAAGLLTIQRGDITSMDIKDSYAVGNYAIADVPAPLANYMENASLVFRDSNWSPDFPTSAALAVQLYKGDHPEAKIDGVIALDQTAISTLLKATGPLTIPNAPEPITSDNLSSYMRASWSTEPQEGVNYDWWLHRKDFIQDMAGALLKQLAHSPWAAIGQAGTQALRERHITVWLTDESAAKLLAEQGWDGAIKHEAGDYLMVVEANIGFNKVNAIIQKQVDYAVDLSSLEAPTATATITDYDPAKGQPPCHHDPNYGSGQYAELINRCYWNYVRVYTGAEAKLLDATLHDIPGDWIMTGQPITGKIDVQEGEHNTTSFGTLMITPFNATENTHFKYSLDPATVLSQHDEIVEYSLNLQKQSGTQGVLTNVSVTLPPNSVLISAPSNGQLTGSQWATRFLLDEDMHFSLRFRVQP